MLFLSLSYKLIIYKHFGNNDYMKRNVYLVVILRRCSYWCPWEVAYLVVNVNMYYTLSVVWHNYSTIILNHLLGCQLTGPQKPLPKNSLLSCQCHVPIHKDWFVIKVFQIDYGFKFYVTSCHVLLIVWEKTKTFNRLIVK